MGVCLSIAPIVTWLESNQDDEGYYGTPKSFLSLTIL